MNERAETRAPTGGDALCHALLAEDVRVLFGHPGGAILPFYDALYRTPELHHVLTRHEQAAAHAADGYARATGRTGVCVATSGPGATNLVTGLATAMMDSVPLVSLTGQVPTCVIGTEAFQETDIVSVTKAVTKQGFQVQDVADLPTVVAEAFHLARAGRPGPVLIDVPKDVQTSPFPAAAVELGIGGVSRWRSLTGGSSTERPPERYGLGPADDRSAR